MKKQISLLLCMIFLFSFKASYASDDIINENDLKLLNALGVCNADINPEASVTRGDFAACLAKTAGSYISFDVPTQNLFEDVKKGNQNTQSIYAVRAAGLMNGISSVKFSPETDISIKDAVVSCIRLLGFEVRALSNGGYPAGYLTVAAEKGLLKGISSIETSLNYANMVKLLSNVLKTDIFKPVNFGDEITYRETEGKNVLALYHNVYKTHGILTADKYASIYQKETPCGEFEIEINKVIYKDENYKAQNFLGKNVTAYYRFSEDDSKGEIVLIIEKEGANKVYISKCSEITSPYSNTIKYFEDGNEHNLKLKRGFSLVKNNEYIENAEISDIFINDGDVLFIDSDSDGYIETVVLKSIETVVASGIDSEKYIIYCRNRGNIEFNASGNMNVPEVYDTDGNKSYFDRIKTGNVLSIEKSSDGKFMRIRVCDKKVSGSITEIDPAANKLTIRSEGHETEYEFVSGVVHNFKLDQYGDFYIDVFGRVVYMKESASKGDYLYGYIIRGEYRNFNKAGLLILTDSDTESFDISGKILLDGVNTVIQKGNANALSDGKNFISQLVRFKCGDNGGISSIDTASEGSGGDLDDCLKLSLTLNAVYNEKFPNFGNKCIIGTGTFFGKVPISQNKNGDAVYYSNDKSVLRDNASYQIEAYNVDDTLKAGAVIYKSDSLGGSAKIDDYSAKCIVIRTFNTIDKNDITCTGVKVFDVGLMSEKTLFFNKDYNLKEDVELGDILLLSTDKDDCIVKYEYEFDYSEGDVSSNVSSYNSYFTKYVGYPYEKEGLFFSMINKKDNPSLDEDSEYLNAFPVSVMSFAEVNFKEKTVKKSSYENLGTFKSGKENADLIFVKVYRGGGSFSDFAVSYKEG